VNFPVFLIFLFFVIPQYSGLEKAGSINLFVFDVRAPLLIDSNHGDNI